MARKKVYVSSTFKDLEEHRSAVKATLERAGFDVECMEKYPAFDERPKDKCLADVAECDYYVLILAWRYGVSTRGRQPEKAVHPHLEYEQAVRLKKPCLAFLLDPKHAWPVDRVDPNALSSRSKIGKFRQTVETAHGRRLHLDVSAGRCGFLDTLALDQIVFLPRHRAGRAVIIAKADETRDAFGNSDSGSTRRDQKGFRCAPRLHSLQSRQTWVGVARRRLAAFEFPSIRALGVVSIGMGGPGGRP